MQSSKIIEIDGVFAGAAITLPDSSGWRFVSVDRRSLDADGRIAPTLQDARSLARRAWFTSVQPQLSATLVSTPTAS